MVDANGNGIGHCFFRGDAKADDAGFFHQIVGTNEEVRKGQTLAYIIDPMDGRVRSEVVAPMDGIVFFAQEQPMIYQNVMIYKMIKKLHL